MTTNDKVVAVSEIISDAGGYDKIGEALTGVTVEVGAAP